MKQVGLVGNPVAHSLSPRMQQAAFDAFGVEACYALWETQPDSLTERIASLRSPDVFGANVTIPYKENVVSLVDDGVAEVMLLGRTGEHLDNILHHLCMLADNMHVTTHIVGTLFGNPEASAFLSTADLVVNATPAGLEMDDTTLLLDVNVLPTTTLVMDMIFNPPQTPLLHAAQAHGCHVLNGLSMLLYQGALAFELWTGLPAPIEVMRKALGIAKEG